jgi:endonuclease YncB( thermonuclease family)
MRRSVTALLLAGLVPLAAVPTGPAGGKPDPAAPVRGKVERAGDADALVVKIDGKPTGVALAGVLPLSRWPRDLDDGQKKLREEARAFLKKWLAGKEVFIYRADRKADGGAPLPADLLLRQPEGWAGASPAEQIGWGMFHMNLLMVQEGFTVYVADEEAVPGLPVPKGAPKWRERAFAEAEKLAEKGKKGIWIDRAFARTLQAVARPVDRRGKGKD